MVRRMFLLVMLGTFLALGGFWALKAQDPQPQQTPTQTTTPTEKQTMPKTTQLDLSGTYTGTFANCEGLDGDTTLTINGDQFTTSNGKSGRIIASKTKGYTAVALQMSGANSKVMSFRGKKSGTKLTLSPVAGATSQCMFTTSKMAKTPTATGTEVANPTTTTPSTTPSQSPSPSPSPTPDASPEPNPSPSGSPSPTPNPSPTEPAPSPTPTPSPSPRM
ncbi:MAG TPA: hypothetical protein VJ784_15020 [Pyrinomonadaceae bacterium]|nr:hypothetical protein [Pyrinomonadaceae bacterium]